MAIRTTESHLHYWIHKVAFHAERWVWSKYLGQREKEYAKR
jgi:hypothetical protein